MPDSSAEPPGVPPDAGTPSSTAAGSSLTAVGPAQTPSSSLQQRGSLSRFVPWGLASGGKGSSAEMFRGIHVDSVLDPGVQRQEKPAGGWRRLLPVAGRRARGAGAHAPSCLMIFMRGICVPSC